MTHIPGFERLLNVRQGLDFPSRKSWREPYNLGRHSRYFLNLSMTNNQWRWGKFENTRAFWMKWSHSPAICFHHRLLPTPIDRQQQHGQLQPKLSLLMLELLSAGDSTPIRWRPIGPSGLTSALLRRRALLFGTGFGLLYLGMPLLFTFSGVFFTSRRMP